MQIFLKISSCRLLFELESAKRHNHPHLGPVSAITVALRFLKLPILRNILTDFRAISRISGNYLRLSSHLRLGSKLRISNLLFKEGTQF